MIPQTIGIIGGGKFGLAIAKLLSPTVDVLLYSRRTSLTDSINADHSYRDITFSDNVRGTNDLKSVCQRCRTIYIVTSSVHLRKVTHEMAPYLSPEHILIHGTKGFDLLPYEIEDPNAIHSQISFSDIKTMSEVILEETDVIRVGAICGPNLAAEIIEGLPTATVIASEYDEVIKKCRDLLTGPSFFVFGSYDLRGAELAGALKNVIAIASGILKGRQLGKNAEAMLITKGLSEIIKIAEVMGGSYEAFLGTAGIGDLIATATSEKSRNFSCGMRIAQGEKTEDIVASMDEVVEGLRSLKIAHHIIKRYRIVAPIISSIYSIIYEDSDIEFSINKLMRFPYASDVDFL